MRTLVVLAALVAALAVVAGYARHTVAAVLNHWITTDPAPLPSNARQVNARDKLLARVRECRKVRHHLPNLVAVNFYREGDVFGVVDRLNGIK